MIVDPESAEHWNAVQDFRRRYGVHPDDVLGADGYQVDQVDSQPAFYLTAAGIGRLKDMALLTGGLAVLERLDELITRRRAQRGTGAAPNGR